MSLPFSIVGTTLLILVTSCGASALPPAALDANHEPCSLCRMVISDRHFASQVVAPYEEPKFFDDMGCLARYLAAAPDRRQAVVYVADHRTAEWIRADRAVYTRVDAVSAAMGSHIMAHESAASRDADPDASTGTPLTAADVFPLGLPGGRR